MKVVGGIETDAPVDVRVMIKGLSVPCPLKYDGKGLDGRHRWRAFAPVTEPEFREREIVVTVARPPAQGHDLEIELSPGVPAPPWYRYEGQPLAVEGCTDCLFGVHHCLSCVDNVAHGKDYCEECGSLDKEGESA